MRKLQREIKRNFLQHIKPGQKPKDTGYGMRMLAKHHYFIQWRERLAKNAKQWRVKHGVM